jgi:hypothetical protein
MPAQARQKKKKKKKKKKKNFWITTAPRNSEGLVDQERHAVLDPFLSSFINTLLLNKKMRENTKNKAKTKRPKSGCKHI